MANYNYLGLAPFLRGSITGENLNGAAQTLMQLAEKDHYDTNLWMNLSTAMLCLGQREVGLQIQAKTLELGRIYQLPSGADPVLRLLVLMVPGDLSANTPLDCLLEIGSISLTHCFVTPAHPLPEALPEHDAVFVAISESDHHRQMLMLLEAALANWHKPVINLPAKIPLTGRTVAGQLLQDIPGLYIPSTERVSRPVLQGLALGAPMPQALSLPVIIRPIDSHAGRGLAKVETAADIAAYLQTNQEPEFFVSRFVNYAGGDGNFRKFRIVSVDGEPFIAHMAVSSNWMVHYTNAGMYEDGAKREEEANFMSNFSQFAQRHRSSLNEIVRRTQLDYLCIDCAELQDGQLMIFEIGNAMVVHGMDPEPQFSYKKPHIQAIQQAFINLLLKKTQHGQPA